MEHQVAMVASNGREVPVTLYIGTTGLALASRSGKPIDSFPFSHLKGSVGSHLRHRKPGPDTCFDLSILTSKGPRDLRLNAGSAEASSLILSHLTRAVKALAKKQGLASKEQLAPSADKAAPPTAAPDDTQPSTSNTSSTAARINDAPGTEPETSPASTHNAPSGDRALPRIPPAAARDPALDDKETSIGPGVRRVDISSLKGTHTGSDAAAQERIQFLEDMVRRLSEDMSKHQVAALAQTGGGEEGVSTTAGMRAAGFLEDLEPGAPLPPWLVDQRYMSPLLVAYDKRVEDLEQQLTSKTTALEGLSARLEEVVAENEGLHQEVKRCMDSAAASSGLGADRGGDDPQLRQRLELMTQENDLLVAQQDELNTELDALHKQLTLRAEENLQLTSELTAASGGLQGRASREEALVVKLEAAEESARAANAQLHTAQAAQRAAEDQLSEVQLAARRAVADHKEAKRTLAGVEQELRSRSSASQAAGSALSLLQAEVGTLREATAAAERERAAGEAEVAATRGAVTALEARLFDYQRKDAEVYSRIKEAMEMAEQAKLARDAGHVRERQLEEEVATLQRRLGAVRAEVSTAAQREAADALSAVERQLAEAKHESAALKDKLAIAQVEMAHAQREAASAAADTQALMREGLAAAQLSSMVGGKVSATAALDALEHRRTAEAERDQAANTLRAAQLKHLQVQREWELERASLESRLTELRRKAALVEGTASHSTSNAAEQERQVGALRRELSDVVAAKKLSEQQLSAKLFSVRMEYDSQAKQLAAKLEAAISANNQSVLEAEDMLASKEQLLKRWKAEAQEAHTRIDVLEAAEDATVASLRREVEQLVADIESLQAENQSLTEQLAEVGAASELSNGLEKATAAAAAARAAMTQAAAQRDELQQETNELAQKLDESELERRKADRKARAAEKKAELLTAQLKATKSSPTRSALTVL